MKTLLAVLMLVASGAYANPYFRGPWDWAKGTSRPSPSVGACIDLKGGPSEQCTTVGVITHSPKDGYVLVPGEDWSLLSVGYAMTGYSKVNPIVSMTYNILPVFTWAGQAAGLNLTIPSISAKGIDLSGSVGPVLEWSDPTGPGHGQGRFKIMASGAVHF